MANFIMSCVTQPIEKFWDHVLNHICYTIHVGAKVGALDDEVDKLKKKRKDVEDKIQLDDTAGKVATEEAKGWLVTAAKLEEEASIISSKYRDRNCMFLGTDCSLNCFSNHSIGVSAMKAKKDVEAERQWIENKEITKVPPPPPVQEVPTATLGESSGTEIRSKCEQALDFLRNSLDGTLGIWGMGGVGKTTLLRHINNALAEDPSSFGFDRVILVTASRGCTTEKIRELIAKELKLPEQGDHYTNIFNYLKNKSFVILLDDLWERLDLENVGVPTLGVIGEYKHKLILTTRSHKVCLDMDARLNNTMRVECLSREKARQLFKEKVGEETIRSHLPISTLADTVADECCGLPLALIAIARAMTGKRLVNLWKKAIEDLRKSKPSEIAGTEDPLPLLKFSYDYLDDPIMQECLLLCALWPEDWKIPVADVVECWMGHNLLGEFNNLEKAYNEGYNKIDSLQKASLLEYSEDVDKISGEGTVSLHDLIRDMALWIATNDKKWVVLADLELKEAPQDERSWKEAHKMSLFHNNISTWPSHTLSAPNLTTLMLQSNLRFSEKFKFHDLDFLRNLHALKYLDMSSNRDMGEFPIAICQLDKLEYLNLSDCDIHSLPEEVKNLKSLKYLLLRNHKIKQVSSQVLSNLVSLEVLDLFGSSSSLHIESWKIDNVVECLKGRRLKSVRINVSPQSESDLNKLARFSVIPIIRDLCIYMSRGENLTSSIHLVPRLNIPCDGTLSNLNELYIRGDSSLVIEELVIDESHDSLPNRLHLQGLKVMKEIVWKGVEQIDVLPKLRDIRLHTCNKLKHVSWIVNLPLLERLHVGFCDSIEFVVCEEATETEREGNNNKTATLPSLKILKLFGLPELESICNRALITLPSLQYLLVYKCPRLKKLPFDSPASCSKLRKIRAEEEWWKSTLELDDDTRTYLQPFCDLD